MKIILREGSAEITEKKSRFIATVYAVRTPDEANEKIAAIRKQYWDARHNCSAMVIGERGEFSRCSDDGEPAGTAGRPMLSVLSGAGVTNALAVVTRYFGGVLLGTGGLVRAYSAAVQEALNACTLSECTEGLCLKIGTDYNGIGKIQYILAQRSLPVTDTSYTDTVEITTLVPAAQAGALKTEITDKTGGRALFLAEDPVRYASSEGEAVLLEDDYFAKIF